MSSDLTLPIVQTAWSEWLFIGAIDSSPGDKVSAVIPDRRGKGSLGDFPVDHKPAIYEIARLPGSPDEPDAPEVAAADLPGGRGRVTYVGRTTGPTQGVRARIDSHFSEKGNLSRKIDAALESGDQLFARFIQFEEQSEAVRLERALRDRLRPIGRYPWNDV